MKLEKIRIHSFRSIIGQEITVNENCLGFIGLNEAGKTNLLDAIMTLNPNPSSLVLKDKSKINNTPPSIDFGFSIENEQKKFKGDLDDHLSTAYNIKDPNPLLKSLSIKNIVVVRKINEDGTDSTEIDFELNLETNKGFKLLTSKQGIAATILVKYGEEEHKLNSIQIIKEKDIPKEFKENYSEIDLDEITTKSKAFLGTILKKNIPSVKYWEYNDKFLLPAEITYDNFLASIASNAHSAPLYNCFLISQVLEIYDVEDIKKKIQEWKSDSGARRKDSEILERDVNKHIKNIWDDYDQELKFALEETKITIHVKDPKSSNMNFYDMSLRSQGFKTFISFILTISAEVQSGILSNYILVLDEPETHLHPSGVKYMRDELLKLSSQKNYVFFATHSIFMINRSNLKSHIIVKKDNETTRLIPVDRNNILQEQVIYEALGTKIDDFSIPSKNVVFEGDLDLKIFNFFLSNCLEKKNNKLSDYQFQNGGGTKQISSFFKNKSVPNHTEWAFVLDKDSPGRKLKDGIKPNVLPEVFKNMRFFFYSENDDYELEEILPQVLVNDSFLEALKTITFNEKTEFDSDKTKPFSSRSKEYYGRNKIKKEDTEKVEQILKQMLDSNIEKELKSVKKEASIAKRHEAFKKAFPDYYKFLKDLLPQLDFDKALFN